MVERLSGATRGNKPRSQKTKPKKGKPVEIQVPKRDFENVLRKATYPAKGSRRRLGE